MPSGAAGREAGRSGQARRPRCRSAAGARTTPAVHTAGRGPGPEASPLPPAPPGRQSSPEERCPRYSAPSWPHRTGPRMRMEEADAKARMGQQKGHQDTRSDPFLPTGAWKSAVLADRSRPSTKLKSRRPGCRSLLAAAGRPRASAQPCVRTASQVFQKAPRLPAAHRRLRGQAGRVTSAGVPAEQSRGRAAAPLRRTGAGAREGEGRAAAAGMRRGGRAPRPLVPEPGVAQLFP